MDLFKAEYAKPKYSMPYGKNLSKDESKYFQAAAEGIYSLYTRGLTGITPENIAEINLLRQYGEGGQSESLYMNLIMGSPEVASPVSSPVTSVDTQLTQEREMVRKGYMNLLWDIVSPSDKIVSALVGKLSKIIPDIRIDTIDPDSVDKKEDMKYGIARYLENKDFEDLYSHMAGLPTQKPETDVMPENMQELDLLDQEGNIRLPYAIAMEQISIATEKLSDWEGIKERIYQDLINIKIAGAYPSYDEASDTVRLNYLDPAMSIIQYSRHPDFRDSEYGGIFEYVQARELVEKGVIKDRDELRKIANSYTGMLGNPAVINVSPNISTVDPDFIEFDEFKVLVLKAYWLDLDEKKDMKITNKFGGTKIVPFTEETKSKNAEVRVTDIRKLYNCKWVVGTEYVYDWGVFEDMVRKNKNEVNFPMFMIRMSGRSIMKQIRPFIDGLMLNWLRYQDAVASAKKAGYAIDYNAIVNLKSGGGKNPEQETIKRLFQTGIIIFKGTSPSGRPNTYQKPVYDIGGGVLGQIQEFIASFQFNTNLIENYTGINPLVLGGGAEKNVALGAQEMSVAGTDNVLQPMVNAFISIMRKSFDYTVDWIQLLLKYNGAAEEAYRGIVGQRNIVVLKEAEANHARYGTFITPAITDFEKGRILQSAETALASGRNGQPGITEADYVSILDGLQSRRSLKLIWLQLDRSIKRSKKEAKQTAQQTMLMDRQATGQLTQQKIQMEDQLEMKKHQYKLEEIAAEGQSKVNQINVEKQHEKDIENIKLAKISPVQQQ